jgi:membrane fusion protein (multidrug efflux system)
MVKNIKTLLIILSILVVILIPFAYREFQYQITHSIIKDAYISTDIINISPQSVSGHIKKLYTSETDKVKKGMLLALIEDTDYKNELNLRKIQIDIAQANYEKIKATQERMKKTVKEMIEISHHNLLSSQELAKQAEESYKLQKNKVEKNIRKAQNQLEVAILNLKKAKENYEKYSRLFKQHAVSQLQFNAVTHKYDVTKAQLDAKKAELSTALTYKKKVSIAHNNLQIAKENLRKALLSYQISLAQKDKLIELEKEEYETLKKIEEAKKRWELSQQKLAQTRITSSINGVVAKKFLNEGDFVSPGTPIYAIYDPNNIFIIANLDTEQLKYIKLGKSVDIKTDSYKCKLYGKIVKIGNIATMQPDSQDDLVNKFKNTKITIRIKILNDDKDLLKPGTPVVIIIKHEH